MNRSVTLARIASYSLVVVAGLVGLASPQAVFAQTSRASEPKSKAPALPGGVALAAMPEEAAELGAALATAKVGETVTFRARVPFAKDAFSGDHAAMTVLDDTAAAACCPRDATLMDTCGVAGSMKALVEVADKSGHRLHAKLDGRGGLTHGTEVFVVGTLTSLGGDSPAVVRATGIYVSGPGLPVGFFSAAAPKDATDLSASKAAGTLKKGDRVTVSGVIGGSKDPFVSGRALFTLIGAALKPCNANPDDACKYPWDYCCETKADILANSATIRVSDEKGNPLRAHLKGRRGIQELSPVTITGTVASVEKGSLVIDATSMYVKP